ncbi:HAMP domain-containing sensor histidine kinase [Halobacteriovorax sp. GB3]|uniref:sensor histidine kinase n=1 Tax=Halobacteriovorax sp. GB3 TaxID=2719615 RepID=UPI00235EC9BB|nr:HAMP domain-containing sensor histidine kinase [Halobacteriovorax sp. GB3]MDD0853383.1 HAMP domain-containing sensor histidine kinase [Halobacteriovorax sp. GB3]
MQKLRWWNRPLLILVLTIIALGVSYYLYLDSYLRVQEAMANFVIKYKLEEKQDLDTQSWVLILILSILLTVILFGMSIIYVYYQKMIQLYRMQQSFINGFTHELKTPIASLRLFLDTFTKHELSREDQLKYLEFMKKDTERLAENVEQILYLGRIEDRSYKGERSTLNLGDFISSIVEKSSHHFDDLTIEFNESDECWCEVDKKLFESLVLNLISNAQRYKKDGQGQLNISLNTAGSKCFLEFQDRGIGLEKKHLKKVFKKFFQVGKSVKGSGLGLYFVWQVTKLHHGSISVHSEGLQKGCLFKLSFPRVIWNKKDSL